MTHLTKEEREALASAIKRNIDAYCVDTYSDGHRKHLGGSLIGESCERKLWYSFRWVTTEKFSGRMYRLFNRGHREEARFVEWLRGIGCEVSEFQDDGKTQYRISDVHGHFGGSLDGMTRLPDNLIGKPLPPMLLEFKTSGTGAAFTDLEKYGVAHAKPKHFAQMSTYGWRYNLRYALYMCINKNDDDIYVEIVELDWNYARELTSKAERVIMAQLPPPRQYKHASSFACKYCAFADVCHQEAPYEKSCRSCVNARIAADGGWSCALANTLIPSEVIPKGCPHYKEAR